MTVHDRRDFRSRTYFSDHRVSWADVWSGLLLTLVLAASAALGVVLFSEGSAESANPDPAAATEIPALPGIQDPRRPGWRPTNQPWNRAGAQEPVPTINATGFTLTATRDDEPRPRASSRARALRRAIQPMHIDAGCALPPANLSQDDWH
jgi:hypothetical protein